MAMAAADGVFGADGHGLVLSVPMYFRLDGKSFRNPESLKKITGLGKICLGDPREPHLELNLGSEFDKLFLFHDFYGSHLSARLYSDGLLTLDIQHCRRDSSIQNMASIRALEHRLLTHLGDLCTEHNSLYCPIRRGQAVWPYAVSADERLLEFDYDELVYETNSKWQNIRIYHSQQQGNALVLDGDSMLGEGDLVYTQTLCRIGEEDYRNKTILVLGGGDGAILHELLKESPRFITMAEIDVEVIKACRKYLRGACGDSLDKLSGKNYKILLEDCTKVLEDSVEKGTAYDFVINDLTEFPVNKSVQGFDYDFGSANLIMNLSLRVLKPDGKLLARGNCVGAVSYRTKFEQDVLSLGCLFRRRDIYVPSFHEVYCLYEIWRRTDDAPGPGIDSGDQLTDDCSNTATENHSIDASETDRQPNEDIPKRSSSCTMEEGIIALKDVSPDNRMDISK